MTALTFAMLNRRWPHAPHALVEGIVATAPKVFAKYGLTTGADQADFLAQISEETGGGAAIEENLNYTAERLVQVWPSRFPVTAAAAPYAHNPRALANAVYGGRFGNRPGGDDGWTYRGRGLIQITFRDWYSRLGEEAALDLIGRPDLANNPPDALGIACAYWKLAGVSSLASAGNFRGETLRINGGLTNLPLREAWRAIWREELGIA